MKMTVKGVITTAVLLCMTGTSKGSFEGIIEAKLTRGSHAESYTYSVGTNMLRLVRNETDHPYATNLIELDSGRMTLIFPHNRAFIRMKRLEHPAASPPGFPEIPIPPGGLPQGIGPQAGFTETGMPQMPDLQGLPMPEMRPEDPARPTRPTRRRSSRELQFSTTDVTTNLFGYACTLYELRQRDRFMEIWATDRLIPFHQWFQHPPRRHHGPQHMEEHWAELLRIRNLFPLQVELKNENGKSLPFEFKVVSVTPKHLGAEEVKLFQPPAEYHELAPPPFY